MAEEDMKVIGSFNKGWRSNVVKTKVRKCLTLNLQVNMSSKIIQIRVSTKLNLWKISYHFAKKVTEVFFN